MADRPEPSPATLGAGLENVMGKPSEMTAEELKEHMADVAERVAADVKEMEERKQQQAGALTPGETTEAEAINAELKEISHIARAAEDRAEREYQANLRNLAAVTA